MMHRMLLAPLVMVLLCGGCAPTSEDADDDEAAVGEATGGLCGASYSLLQTFPIKNSGGTVLANVNVYWSATEARHCAVTRSSSLTWGVQTWRNVAIQTAGQAETHVYNDYDSLYTAGPVYGARSGRCIRHVDGCYNQICAHRYDLFCN